MVITILFCVAKVKRKNETTKFFDQQYTLLIIITFVDIFYSANVSVCLVLARFWHSSRQKTQKSLI